MKTLFKSFIINVFSLWVLQEMVTGFKISGGLENLLMVGAALTLIDTFIKPLLKILFIPINMATLGLFSLVINAGVFFALDYFFTNVTVSAWQFDGISYNGFVIPDVAFGIIGTYFVGSFIISLLVTFLKWL